MARVLAVGLDGVPFGLLTSLVQRGTLGALGPLASAGRLVQIPSTVPPLSSVAWSTILTGADPGAHGIFGFVDLDPHTYRYRIATVLDLRAPPLWELLSAAGKKVVFLNVPGTYPAQPLNGVLVSGFVAPELSKAVWPRRLGQELASWGYRIDVAAHLAERDLRSFFADLHQVLALRRRLIRETVLAGQWDFCMVVFTGTDRLLHFCYDAWQDSGHPFHRSFLEYFSCVNDALTELLGLLREDDTVVVLSDHGFGPLRREIYTNEVLCSLGFASFGTPVGEDLTGLQPQSKAFGLDPGRVYVHRSGRYSRGTVQDPEAVQEELEAALRSFRLQGEAVAGQLCRREELYRGPFAHLGPDLVVLGRGPWEWKGRVGTGVVCRKTHFTGRHTRDDAFLLVGGCRADLFPDRPELTAVASFVLQCLEVPHRRGTE